jgi:hypothetical protein
MVRFVSILLLLIASPAAWLQCAVVHASLTFDVVTQVTRQDNSPTRRMTTLHASRNPPSVAFPCAIIDLRGGALEEKRRGPVRAFADLCGRWIARLLKKIVFEMIPMATAVGIGTYFGYRVALIHTIGNGNNEVYVGRTGYRYPPIP